jgi:hypothetical protein
MSDTFYSQIDDGSVAQFSLLGISGSLSGNGPSIVGSVSFGPTSDAAAIGPLSSLTGQALATEGNDARDVWSQTTQVGLIVGLVAGSVFVAVVVGIIFLVRIRTVSYYETVSESTRELKANVASFVTSEAALDGLVEWANPVTCADVSIVDGFDAVADEAL